MIVEICANSFKSALAAQHGGANRIELCADLSVGGVTPARDVIRRVISEIAIPVHVLIRPRSGDFCYSEDELQMMLADIAYCEQMGCTGVVSGVLTPNNTIDVVATKRLMDASNDMEFTFHRAFDLCVNPLEAIQKLMALKVNRLLSSGQQPKAIEGITLLTQLKEIVGNTIEIMPGGGIHAENALAFKDAGFEMIHTSATQKVPSAGEGFFDTKVLGHSSQEEIEKMRKVLS